VLPLLVLTNCDEVEIRYGDGVVKRVGPDRETFPHLPHAPVVLDRRHFTAEELGLWGMEWHDATFTGFVGGKPAKTVRYVADPVATTLEVVADATAIGAADAVRVMVRALDQAGHKLPFFPEPVTIGVTGAGRLLGPRTVPLRAGSTGFWVQATEAGTIDVTVTSDRLGTVTLGITAR
jgi:beta-galactosidase